MGACKSVAGSPSRTKQLRIQQVEADEGLRQNEQAKDIHPDSSPPIPPIITVDELTHNSTVDEPTQEDTTTAPEQNFNLDLNDDDSDTPNFNLDLDLDLDLDFEEDPSSSRTSARLTIHVHRADFEDTTVKVENTALVHSSLDHSLFGEHAVGQGVAAVSWGGYELPQGTTWAYNEVDNGAHILVTTSSPGWVAAKEVVPKLVNCVAEHPDGLIIALLQGDGWSATGSSKQIQAWDVNTGEQHWESNEVRHMTCVTVNQKTGVIFTGCVLPRGHHGQDPAGPLLQAYDSSGQLLHSHVATEADIAADRSSVSSMVIHYTDQAEFVIWITCARPDRRRQNWQLFRQEYLEDSGFLEPVLMTTLQREEGRVNPMALWPGKDKLILGTGNTIQVWDIGTHIAPRSSATTSSYAAPAALPSGSSEAQHSARDWPSPIMVFEATGSSGLEVVYSVAALPDGRYASCGRDKYVRVWSADGEEEQKLGGFRNYVYAVTAHGDGRIIAGSYDKTVRVWGPQGTLLAILKGTCADLVCLESFPHV